MPCSPAQPLLRRVQTDQRGLEFPWNNSAQSHITAV
jgi:hypothetical protein